ncbi:unnamed protein product, partial [Ectocarpus sp. 12 AP-2014]
RGQCPRAERHEITHPEQRDAHRDNFPLLGWWRRFLLQRFFRRGARVPAVVVRVSAKSSLHPKQCRIFQLIALHRHALAVRRCTRQRRATNAKSHVHLLAAHCDYFSRHQKLRPPLLVVALRASVTPRRRIFREDDIYRSRKEVASS